MIKRLLKEISAVLAIGFILASLAFIFGYKAALKQANSDRDFSPVFIDPSYEETVSSPREKITVQKRDNVRQTSSRGQEELDIFDISTEDKRELIAFCYSATDKYFDKSINYSSISKKNFFKNFDFDRAFLTLSTNNRTRGCMSGRVREKTGEALPAYLESCSVRTINDERFGGVVSEVEVREAEISLTFFYNRQRQLTKSYDALSNAIEPGIHGIEIQKGNARAFYKETVQIEKNWSLQKTLEQLCLKGGLDKNDWKDEATEIYRYDTLTFKGDRQGRITNLYRNGTLLNVQDITPEEIYRRISLAKSWFLKTVNARTGLLEYRYSPSYDYYLKANSHIRQLGSLWAFTVLKKFLKTDDFDELINTTLEYYLKFRVDIDEYSCFVIDNDRDANIAYSAFMIMALSEYPDYPDRETILKRLAEGLLAMQKPDGSFITNFVTKEVRGVDFYPGESLLALMTLYQVFPDERYIDAVKRAFPYYRSYWRGNPVRYFVPWQTMAYGLLYDQTKDRELADFIFEMNDWLINSYQILKNPFYKDELGGFAKPVRPEGLNTYSCMEAVNEAYRMALLRGDKKHIEKYKESIRLGTRFALQCQMIENNSFYVDNLYRTLGGFKLSLRRNWQRNDYTQHAVLGLIKTYQHKIFE